MGKRQSSEQDKVGSSPYSQRVVKGDQMGRCVGITV